MLRVYAECPDDSIVLYVDPEADYGGDGRQQFPYLTIMDAFDERIQGQPFFTSFCLKLIQRQTSHELNSQNASEDFRNLNVDDSITRIHMLSWDPVVDAESTTNVVIQYNDPLIVWDIVHAMELSFSYVEFRSDLLMDPECNSEICRHWHFEDHLDENQETGTGVNFDDYPELWDKGYLIATNDPCAGWKHPEYALYIEHQHEQFWPYGLFNVAASGAVLRMSNWIITEFRFRPSWIINMSGGGSAILNNVDFINVEPGKRGHQDQENLSSGQSARGVITSFQKSQPQGSAEFDECTFEGQDPFESDETNEANTVSPKPCGQFIWNGGKATGLNKDVNLREESDADSVQFYGFLDLRHLQEVSITDVDFTYNIIPIIYPDENYTQYHRPIVLIQSCSKISFSNWNFENNMAQNGAVYIYYDFNLWDYDVIDPWKAQNLYSVNTEVITIQAWNFIGNMAFSPNNDTNMANALKITSNWPINVEIRDCTFVQNNSPLNHSGTLVIQATSHKDINYSGTEPICSSLEDNDHWHHNDNWHNENQLVYFETGQYLNLRNNTFVENFSSLTLQIQQWSNVLIENNSFIKNSAYDYSTACTGSWSTIQKFIDTGRIRENTGHFSRNWSEDDWHKYTKEIVSWDWIIKSTQIYGLEAIGSNTFSLNSCNDGAIWEITNLDEHMIFSDATFEQNSSQSQNGGWIHIDHSIAYNQDTMDDTSIPEFKNIVFTENSVTNTKNTYISACISNTDNLFMESDKMRLKVTSCAFKKNHSKVGSAIYWEGAALIISNSTFEENVTDSTEILVGGAIFFVYTLDTSEENVIIGEFSVSQWTFTNNQGNYSPDIATYDNVESQQSYIIFKIESSTFTRSQADQAVGSMNIGQHSFTQENDEHQSYISFTIFDSIHAQNGQGSILIQHVRGVLILSDLQFDGMISNALSCGITGAYGSDSPEDSQNRTYVKMINSTIQNWTWNSFMEISSNVSRMNMITENLLVQHNYFAFAFIENGQFSDTGSIFQYNSATAKGIQNGTVLIGTYTSEISFHSSQFLNNVALEHGGAIFLSIKTTYASFYNITATENSAAKGGFLYVQDNASFVLEQSYVSSNTASKGSAIFIISSEQSRPIVRNTQIDQNVGYGSIFLIQAWIDIYTSILESNTMSLNSEDKSAGIVLMFSGCTSTQNTFRNQTSTTGAFLQAISNSYFTDDGSTFSNGLSDLGGLGYIVSTEVKLTRSTIADMLATKAGLLYATLESGITLSDVSVKNSNTLEVPSIIYASDTSLTLKTSSFENFNSTGIQNDGSSELFSIENCNFSNEGYSMSDYPLRGGALQLIDVEQFQVSGSIFKNFIARLGGAFHFEANHANAQLISNNTFIDCSACQGGAIYNDGAKLTLLDNLFYNNFAITVKSSTGSYVILGDGGALYTTCPSNQKIDRQSNYTNNYFEGNYADHDGGAVKWLGLEPINIGLMNYFVNNSAQYGKNIASTANYLKMVSLDDNRILQNTNNTLQNVASGQQAPKLCIGIYDKYSALVSTQNTANWLLLAVNSNTTSITGIIRILAIDGIFWFDEFQVVAEPGTSVQIETKTQVSDSEAQIFESAIEINIQLRECVSGESLMNNECVICGAGTYSLDPKSEECQECPTGAVWYGNNTLSPKKGYWRPQNESDQFFSCPFSEACIGGELEDGVIHATGKCKDGYEGNKCQACSDGYSRVGKTEWYECPDLGENIAILIVIVLVSALGIIVLVKSTLTSANKSKSLHSIYMRIFVNYLQVIMLMISFNLSWPYFVYELLSYQQTAGSVTGQIYSLDCLSNSISSVHPYYANVLLVSVLPIIIIILSVAFWGIVALVKKRKDYMSRQLVSTVIIILFLIHPNVVRTMIALFSWTEIEKGEWWLMDEQDLRCWQDEHIWYVTRISIPALIVWGLCIPCGSLTLLLKNRKNLQHEDVKLKYGFLFLGYSRHSYFWEFIIMYRKVLIAFASVFLASVSVTVQGLIAFFILIISLLLQIMIKPYDHKVLNRLEVYSIITAVTTIYCGLFYITDSLDNNSNIFLFLVILISNAIFIGYWGKYMFQSIIFKVLSIIMRRNIKVRHFQNSTTMEMDKSMYSTDINQPICRPDTSQPMYTTDITQQDMNIEDDVVGPPCSGQESQLSYKSV